MVSNCSGRKRDGSPCTLSARGDNGFCWAHDPSHAAERRQIASKAGKAKGPGGEILEIKKRIRELSDGVVEGTVDKGRASVAFQGLGVLCRFIEVERRIKVDEELEKRIEELESVAAEDRAQAQWGV